MLKLNFGIAETLCVKTISPRFIVTLLQTNVDTYQKFTIWRYLEIFVLHKPA
jgi:hypothetical protein